MALLAAMVVVPDSSSSDGNSLQPSKKQGYKRISMRNDNKVGRDEIVLRNTEISQQKQQQQDKPLPPLVSALKTSAQQNAATFHFPGHNRGRLAPSSLTNIIGLKPFMHDLPELPELDNLFSPLGPILDAQQQAANLFGALETWFLVGGTTCGIQAAIMATCSPGDYLILPRNSHLSAISAMVLSGAIPKYIIPEYDAEWDIAGGVIPSQVEKAIQELETEGRKPAAVFVTSPTYHGICSNLSKIAQLCHSRGIPVIVDEAHGAHLGFHPHMPKSALQQGADLAVQSTHKVLCSLTQSSMLHMSGNLVDRERVSRCLQTLQSTSPSYLLLASLDAARHQLSENPEAIFDKVLQMTLEAKNAIRGLPGICALDSLIFSKSPAIDPLRLTIGFGQLGLSGYEADEVLYEDHEIICELVGTRSITFALNIGTCREHVERLVSGLRHIVSSATERVVGKADHGVSAPFADFTTSLIPRDAFFKSKRKVSIENCLGEVCGELICPYPPGIPVMIPGETITQSALDYLVDVRSKGAVISGASDPQLSSIVVCNK
ncbi:Ornithine/lysine/arginine decarboxylase [Parasponia andersonii]|uniref:Ornithine/lysine/arginine decarboxylase n=1 Tax=Parasponia andersonii TaxID=3476 RepID=A0A2P5AX94_PARAD|nr:Ornithine/lysine/arginine decarboxylase [Parasponia andersonii]